MAHVNMRCVLSDNGGYYGFSISIQAVPLPLEGKIRRMLGLTSVYKNLVIAKRLACTNLPDLCSAL